MVQCKLLKQLEILNDKKFDDEDVVEDIKFLTEFLETSVQDLRYLVCLCVSTLKGPPINVVMLFDWWTESPVLAGSGNGRVGSALF